jgi:hypothetical protein
VSRFVTLVPLLPALLFAGCGVTRNAAESAVAEVQAAYSGIASEAEDVTPDEARLIEDALAQAKDDLAKGNFSATRLAVTSLRHRVKELADRLPGRRAELEAAWAMLEAAIPDTLSALERKLGRANRPSAGARRAEFDAARKELSNLTALWAEARAAEQLGRTAAAVTKASDVKYRALRLLDGAQAGS